MMRNPFGPEQDGLFHYVTLQKRMLERVRRAQIDDRIFEVVQQAYEHALKEENIVLSRPEKRRLLSRILKLTLEDMIEKLEKGSSPQ